MKAFADGNNEEGVTILEQVLSDFPENVDALANLGTYYLESKQTEKAIECYRKAAELEPLNGTIWHYFSLAYCDARQFKKAASASMTALALEPQNQKIWLNHGYILEQGDLPRDYLAFEKIKIAINVKRKELGLPQVNIT
ncbi:MAG: tetratricopeptide repeat protein [Candidatus Heimdallarchaeota archaeon]